MLASSSNIEQDRILIDRKSPPGKVIEVKITMSMAMLMAAAM